MELLLLNLKKNLERRNKILRKINTRLESLLTSLLYHKIYIMKSDTIKTIAKYGLGAMLITAGIGHLTFARKEFQAQVPNWVPLEKDDTVVYSGVAEIALGTVIITAPKKYESIVGKIAGTFFTAVFPGNIAQYKNDRDSFGLNTDGKRLARLFMQPLLVFWALKSTEK